MPLRPCRLALPVLVALLLSACGRPNLLDEWRMSPPARQRAAFPPPGAFADAAAAAVRTAGAEGSPPRQAFEAELERRLDRRVRECLPGPEPGRWTRVSTIRRAGADHACLGRHEAALLDWFAQQDLARLLRQPPIAPARPIGPLHVLADGRGPVGQGRVVALHVAEAADRAVITMEDGSHRVVDIADGRVLRSLDAPPAPQRPPALSPNGRVLALATQPDALDFVEVDSGRTVWRLMRPGRPVAFLAAQDAVLAADRTDGATLVVDLGSGQALPHPVVRAGLEAAWPAEGPAGTWWLLSTDALLRIEHQRTSAAVGARRAGGAGWPMRDTSAALPPVGLADDTVFVARGRGGELSILRQREDRWSAESLELPMPWIGPVRLDDRRVLMQLRQRAGPSTFVAFDPAERSAAVLAAGSDEDVLWALGRRAGFALVDLAVVRIAGEADLGAARPIAELLDELRRSPEPRP